MFIFDNSQNHHARRPDALWAANLNLSDGGKHIKPLRNTTWNGVVQLMQTTDGKQKGIKTILTESGLTRHIRTQKHVNYIKRVQPLICQSQ